MALEAREFSQRLIALREGKRWTQQTAAEHIGVSQRTLARWEDPSDIIQPHLGNLEKVIVAYSVSAETLTGQAEHENGRLQQIEAEVHELLTLVRDHLVPLLAAQDPPQAKPSKTRKPAAKKSRKTA